jgi:hypothetical protein
LLSPILSVADGQAPERPDLRYPRVGAPHRRSAKVGFPPIVLKKSFQQTLTKVRRAAVEYPFSKEAVQRIASSLRQLDLLKREFHFGGNFG